MQTTSCTRWTMVVCVVLLTGTTATAQGSRPLSHRPWIGLWAGPGAVTGNKIGADLGVSIEVPVWEAVAVRVQTGRLWTTYEKTRDLGLQHIAADVLLQKHSRGTSTCVGRAYAGIGLGRYRFELEPAAGGTPVRKGYHLIAGFDCRSTRVSLGFQITTRFIGGPDTTRSTISSVGGATVVTLRM